MAKTIWHCVKCSSVMHGEAAASWHALEGHEVHEESLCYRYGDELGHSDCPALPCPTCGGSGGSLGPNEWQGWRPCPDCNGSGVWTPPDSATRSS